MSRSILLALFVSSIILVGFVFFSQQYRNNVDNGSIAPTLTITVLSAISPTEPPVMEASYHTFASTQ